MEILVLGDAPTPTAKKYGEAFAGPERHILFEMLNEVGINPKACKIVNVSSVCPPYGDEKALFDKFTPANVVPSETLRRDQDNIKELISTLKPALIIALGNIALGTLTGEYSVEKWRGSQLEYVDTKTGHIAALVPTYSPSRINVQWANRSIGLLDLNRAARYRSWVKPVYNFVVRPTYSHAVSYLRSILERASRGPIRVSLDIETRAGHIACAGFGISETEAICIPFMKKGDPNGYWGFYEELNLVRLIRQLFRHPNIRWLYQNGNYDRQYTSRHWGLFSSMYMDTMLAHHTLWAGLPKSLDFLASMYCKYYQYWKDDGRHFDLEHHDEERLWTYNCQDCVVTWEVADVLDGAVDAFNQREQFSFQMQQADAVLRMMLRGVRRDADYRTLLRKEMDQAKQEREQWLAKIIGHPVNIKSPKQMKELFYVELGLPEIKKRGKKGKPGTVSTDDKSLDKLWRKMPCVKPVVDTIKDLRSIGVFTSTFIEMRTDYDDRIRCSYNVAGTETFRYSSARNAFDSGGNLQNIPKGGSKEKGRFSLPNIRKMFLPDEGYILLDVDLAGADAQVVAWEAGDPVLKQMFREKVDVHLENAKSIFNKPGLTKDSYERKLAKVGVHATNYGASASSISASLGITMAEAELFQYRWFQIHPEIKQWHEHTLHLLQTKREVRNKFGFRRYYFDRLDNLLPEALAWVPQSTVAIVTDKGLVNIDAELPDVMPLLQVHDSIVMQVKKEKLDSLLPEIQRCLTVPIPYDDPLTINFGIEASDKSWGDVDKISWTPKKAA